MKTELAAAFASERIDDAAGVIYGVSVITEGQAKGHGFDIDQTTLSQVAACGNAFPDGVQVKVNHGTGFDAIAGTLKNFRVDGDKVRADLRLLKSHPRYASILEMAKEMPGSFGLSISFSGKTEQNAARCTELYSVDFVDRPAANPDGLFSVPVDSQAKGISMNVAEFVAEVKSLLTGEQSKAATELSAKATELTAKVEKLTTDLAAAQSKVTELETKLSQTASDLGAAQTSVTALTKERDELKATIENPDGEIEKRASLRALEIAKSQGTTAVTLKAGETTTDNSAAELAEIKKLSGLAKVIALEKLENKNRKTK